MKSCVLVQTPCLLSFIKIFHHLEQLYERKLTNFCYLVGAFTLFFFTTNGAQKGNHLRWLIKNLRNRTFLDCLFVNATTRSLFSLHFALLLVSTYLEPVLCNACTHFTAMYAHNACLHAMHACNARM